LIILQERLQLENKWNGDIKPLDTNEGERLVTLSETFIALISFVTSRVKDGPVDSPVSMSPYCLFQPNDAK
jgi:hypothetical protein